MGNDCDNSTGSRDNNSDVDSSDDGDDNNSNSSDNNGKSKCCQWIEINNGDSNYNNL